MEEKNTSITFDGREIRLTTGLYAPQAGGSVMIECGDTSLLVTATKTTKKQQTAHKQSGETQTVSKKKNKENQSQINNKIALIKVQKPIQKRTTTKNKLEIVPRAT